MNFHVNVVKSLKVEDQNNSYVLNWLLTVEQKSKKIEVLLQEIDRRSKKACSLFYGMSEQNGNEMAYSLAVAGVGRGETFKAWW